MRNARMASALRESLVLNAWPLGLLSAFLIGGAAAGAHYGFSFGFIVFQGFWTLFNVAGFGLILAVGALIELVRARPDRPLAHLRGKMRDWQVGRRLRIALPILLIAPVLFSAFSAVKSGIPMMHPFDMDLHFVDLDRAIHGTDPWRLLEPLLRSPIIVFAINIAYHAWFFLFYAALALAAAMVRDFRLRNQFLVAFILCWVGLGLVLATQLSSVGPVFLAAFYPGVADPFAEQMALLRAADQVYPIWALDVQALLLEGARNPDNATLGRGISAMPSLHVSIAVLMALFAWRVSRPLGIAATVFAVIIQIGSVALAWHYAVDGYLSAILTPMIWVFSGWLVGPHPRLAALPRLAKASPVPIRA